MSFCKVPPDARHWVPARQDLWLGWEEGCWLRALILSHRGMYTFWTNATFIHSLTFSFSLKLQRVRTAQKITKNPQYPPFPALREFFTLNFLAYAQMCTYSRRYLRGFWGFVFILSLLFMNMLLNKLTVNKCLSVGAEYNVSTLVEYVRPQKPVWNWGDEENHIHMS